MDKWLRERRKFAYMFNEWEDTGPNLSEFPDPSEDIIVQAVVYFFHKKSKCIQPFKSVYSTIIYARCMERYFNINFYEALSDPELMYDDNWYMGYIDYPTMYDKIIEQVPDIWKYKESISESVRYFKREFLVEEEDEFDTD